MEYEKDPHKKPTERDKRKVLRVGAAATALAIAGVLVAVLGPGYNTANRTPLPEAVYIAPVYHEAPDNISSSNKLNTNGDLPFKVTAPSYCTESFLVTRMPNGQLEVQEQNGQPVPNDEGNHPSAQALINLTLSNC